MFDAFIGGIAGGIIVSIPVLVLGWIRDKFYKGEASARYLEMIAMAKQLGDECHTFQRELNTEVSKAFQVLSTALTENTKAMIAFGKTQVEAAVKAASKVVEVAETVAETLDKSKEGKDV